MLRAIAAVALSAVVALPVAASADARGFEPPRGGPVLRGEYLESAPGAKAFSMLVRSRRRGAPLVVYLAGGPGAASVASGFLGNGPWSLTRPFAAGGGGSLAVRRNRWSWNRLANVVYLDQPRYSGYSTGSAQYVASMATATSDFIRWLDRFRARHPALARRPLYLAGESFAGQYIPAFAGALLAGGSARSRNLAGLMLISPLLQSASYPPRLDLAYLCDRRFLPGTACEPDRPDNLRAALDDCVTRLAADAGRTASAVVMAEVNNSQLPSCTEFAGETQPNDGPSRPYTVPDSARFPQGMRGQTLEEPLEGSYFPEGGLVRRQLGYSPNPWEMALPCRPSGGFPPWCYDDHRIERFFNDPAVRKWVGGARLPAGGPWRFAQWPVSFMFASSSRGRSEPSLKPFTAALRRRLPVSIVVGKDDYDINPYRAQWYVDRIVRNAYRTPLFRSVPAAARRMRPLRGRTGARTGDWVRIGRLRFSQLDDAGHEAALANPRAIFGLFAGMLRGGP